MKFSDLDFCHNGCCGTHNWAVVTHPSGIRSEVVDEGDGTYSVAARAGNVLLRAPELCQTHAAVEARLAGDALLRE